MAERVVDGRTERLYVLLTRTGSLVGELVIHPYTQQPYGHVSLAFDESLRDVYSFVMVKGFVKETLAAYPPDTTYSLYELRVTPAQKREARRQVEALWRRRHKLEFNLMGMATGFLLGRPVENKDAMFCSQFVVTVLKAAGVDCFKKPAYMTTPFDVVESREFRFVSKGRLRDLWEGADGDPREDVTRA
jgi:hypothetical protein